MFHERSLPEEVMAKSVVGETYEAFKACRRQEFASQHAGRTITAQQKLLRVHLRHFLLTVGAEVDHGRRQVDACTDAGNQEENKDDGFPVCRGFVIEQKRLAVDREKIRAQRHQSARVIQSFVRRRSKLRENVAREGEVELPSTSILIALEVAKPATPPTNPIVIAPVDVYVPQIDPPRSTALPPYEVVVELVSARELALGFGSAGSFDGKYIEVELLLKRQSKVIARVAPTRQFVSSFLDNSAEILLRDCSLRFAIDLNNGMKHGISSPQSVIDEISAAVIVKNTSNDGGGSSNALGVVGIPLSLLETPLATEYALCRWFPLEKAYPGHTARGDLRVSVCYLMRQTNNDKFTMVPYVNTTNSNKLDEKTIAQEPNKPSTRRIKKTAGVTMMAQRKVSNNKIFHRKRAIQATDQANKPEKLKPPVLSMKDSLSNPIGRISRAEALSPPPSPSSVTSSEAGDSTHSTDSPKASRPVQVGRRFFPPKRQQKQSKPTTPSPPKEEPIIETKANSPKSPPKNFLKRKPYRVVFHKLDWSRVASKTDSNLSTSNSGRNNSGVSSRSSRTSRSSSRASSSSRVADNSADTEVDTNVTSTPTFIDAHTAQRLTALETAMLERCCVTKETASLALFKYQAERKKFVATLQSQAEARIQAAGAEPEQPPSQESCEPQLTEAAVTELWKKLSGDASGQIYASMLRGFTERPAKPIEETGS